MRKGKKCEFFVNLTKIFGLNAEKQTSHPYLCFIYGDKKEKSLKCEVFVNIALFFVVNKENGSFFLIYSIERFFTEKLLHCVKNRVFVCIYMAERAKTLHLDNFIPYQTVLYRLWGQCAVIGARPQIKSCIAQPADAV